MKIHDFKKLKENGEKITMITCYDHWSASIIADSDIDCVLVGDSLAMVMYGHSTTIPATIDIMAQHIEAVTRGLQNKKFIIGDMPFCSYRKDLTSNMNAVEKIVRAGAQAIKLENAEGNLSLIEHIVTSGIPVMGHIGLTIQTIHTLGGFKAQGKDESTAKKLKENAKALEKAGCFAIVLECIPQNLAKEITDALNIPTIGIGAGPHTSGQVLVLQDMLGMQHNFKPKFLKTYMNGFDIVKNALNNYVCDVKKGEYPNIDEHCY